MNCAKYHFELCAGRRSTRSYAVIDDNRVEGWVRFIGESGHPETFRWEGRRPFGIFWRWTFWNPDRNRLASPAAYGDFIGARYYRAFVSFISGQFPLSYALIISLVAVVCWVTAVGAPETRPGAPLLALLHSAITALCLCIAFSLSGAAYNAAIEPFPAFEQKRLAARLPNGLHNPIDGAVPYFDSTYYDLANILVCPLFLIVHAAIPCLIFAYWRPFLAGLHYLFVPHPAEKTINRASGRKHPPPLDANRLADDLEPTSTLNEEPPPSFVSNNMAMKAEKLREKAEAQRERYEEEARLAEEAIEMERARRRRDDPEPRSPRKKRDRSTSGLDP